MSFGAWALAERRLTEWRLAAPAGFGAAPFAWRALRVAAGVAGALAAALAVYGFLFGVLGTWIS